MTCTFFGHRVVTNDVKTRLRVVITDLIVHHAVDVFYVGNQGGFDEIVSEVLRELQTIYPIDYAVVLAYFPIERDGNGTPNPPDTIYPEGLETVPKRFVICYRNRRMPRASRLCCHLCDAPRGIRCRTVSIPCRATRKESDFSWRCVRDGTFVYAKTPRREARGRFDGICFPPGARAGVWLPRPAPGVFTVGARICRDFRHWAYA